MWYTDFLESSQSLADTVRISCRISPFGGGELKDFGGGSSLGPLGVKNKVSTNLGGGSN